MGIERRKLTVTRLISSVPVKTCVIALAISLITVASASPTLASTDVSPQLWLDYNPSHSLSPRVDLYGDVGVRRELQNKGWWRLVVRPGMAVQVGHYRIAAGVGNFFTFNQLMTNRWELRPFQGVYVVWPSGRLAFEHFVRLEERFDFNTETWDSFDSLRLRYQLRISYRWGAYRPGRTWKLTGTMEPFLTLAGQQGQQREEVRATIGVERTVGHGRRGEPFAQSLDGPEQPGPCRRPLL